MPQHHIESVDVQSEVVQLVQLTDTHLCRSRGGTLLGMDTDHSLQAVINLVQKERPDIDLLLGTGDLSDGGASSAYERLQDYFDQLTRVNYWLPGNHDDRAAMEAVVATPARLCREIRLSHWQILLLDSQIVGHVGGELGEAELMLLERSLAAAQEEGRHTLVCLHHQPVPIGSKWLDQQRVADADAFFKVLDRYTGVKGVLWGHVHQEIDRIRNGVRLLASPSTCVQFAPGSESFKVDDQPPGYRWLELHSDGRFETGVSRVLDTKFTVDLDSGGYL
jgi:Icc protein